MSRIKNKTESIQLSMFCNIICQLLCKHESLSICKMVTLSYLIKQNGFIGCKIYSANNKQDVILKGLSLLSGDFNNFCNSVPYIVKAIHILIKNGIVKMENDILSLTDYDMKFDLVYEESNFMNNMIEDSKFMTDRQFMKEVIYNV